MLQSGTDGPTVIDLNFFDNDLEFRPKVFGTTANDVYIMQPATNPPRHRLSLQLDVKGAPSFDVVNAADGGNVTVLDVINATRQALYAKATVETWASFDQATRLLVAALVDSGEGGTSAVPLPTNQSSASEYGKKLKAYIISGAAKGLTRASVIDLIVASGKTLGFFGLVYDGKSSKSPTVPRFKVLVMSESSP